MITKSLLSLVWLPIILGACFLRADEQADNPAAAQGRTFGNGILSSYAAFYDADSNGALSTEELQLLQSDRRKIQLNTRNQWDLDKDGTISPEEARAARLKIQQRIDETRVTRFDEVDTDRDSSLTKREFFNITAVATANATTPGVANTLFENLDRNGDQLISKEEFLRRLNEITPVPVPVDRSPTPHPRQPVRND
ncbi:MAG: EF-hand domain-containing protein [Verrucomicrobiaceae bacterium]